MYIGLANNIIFYRINLLNYFLFSFGIIEHINPNLDRKRSVEINSNSNRNFVEKKKMEQKNFILDKKISQNLLIKGQDDLKKSLKNKKIKINLNNIKEIF